MQTSRDTNFVSPHARRSPDANRFPPAYTGRSSSRNGGALARLLRAPIGGTMMCGEEYAALLVMEPGEFRESIRAMLISILPEIRILDASDLVTAESLIRLQRPCLVIIDGDLHTDPPLRLVETAQKTRQRPRCCMLAETVGQQASALAAGADHAVVKGEPALQLFSKFEQFLMAA